MPSRAGSEPPQCLGPGASPENPMSAQGPRPQAIFCCCLRLPVQADSEVRHPGHEWVPIWDADAAGRGLACHTNMPAPRITFLNECYIGIENGSALEPHNELRLQKGLD